MKQLMKANFLFGMGLLYTIFKRGFTLYTSEKPYPLSTESSSPTLTLFSHASADLIFEINPNSVPIFQLIVNILIFIKIIRYFFSDFYPIIFSNTLLMITSLNKITIGNPIVAIIFNR